MAEKVVMEVEPAGGIWRVTVAGAWIGNFKLPFYAGARELLARGYAPECRLEMRHGNGVVGMRGTIGEAARWTIAETAANGPRAVKWQPWPGMGEPPGEG